MSSDILKCRNVEALRRALEDGAKAKYVFFWNDDPSYDDSITASCLSQWYVSPFTVDGDVFPTAEHFMMAEKARLFGDLEAREQILNTKQPGAAKSIGRAVRNFSQERWSQCRFDVVVAANMAKFGQNEAISKFLLNTSKRVLVEASPVDQIWGIGYEAGAPQATNPHQWRGLNLLGFALMEVRSRLAIF